MLLNSKMVLQGEIRKAERQLAKIQRQIDHEEQKCQTWQRGLDELNRWYCCTTQPELEKLGIEITRRTQAISQSQVQISYLETEKLVAKIWLDNQRVQLDTLLNGMHERSRETGSRLLSVQCALQLAHNELRAIQSKAN